MEEQTFATGIAKPEEPETKRRRQPPYNVVLWDDNDHTYEYVIHMMRTVFGFTEERGYQVAQAVDSDGKAICLTTTREHAELKQQQIHAFGKDGLIPRCKGSMSATIEPTE